MGIVVCGFAFQTLLPGLLDEDLGRSPSDVGPVFLSLAVAGLLATLPLAGIVRSPRAWPILLGAGYLMAVGFVLLSRVPSFGLAIVAGVPLGIGRSAFMLVDNSLLMASSEPAYHGRVMSLAMMGFGSQALLAPVWGAIADAVGVRTTLLVVGLAAAAITTLIGLNWLGLRRRAVAPRPVVGVEAAS
jgi:predicted MFS family arabinose efflux permease